MSWASDDPEKYIELQVEGVLAKLAALPYRRKGWKAAMYDVPDADEVAVVWELAQNPDAYHIWRVLVDWADKEIQTAEGNYFGGLTDDAHERFQEWWRTGRGFTPLAETLSKVPTK